MIFHSYARTEIILPQNYSAFKLLSCDRMRNLLVPLMAIILTGCATGRKNRLAAKERIDDWKRIAPNFKGTFVGLCVPCVLLRLNRYILVLFAVALTGTLAGFGEHGELLLQTTDGIETIWSGDVS